MEHMGINSLYVQQARDRQDQYLRTAHQHRLARTARQSRGHDGSGGSGRTHRRMRGARQIAGWRLISLGVRLVATDPGVLDSPRARLTPT
jgi:hypothetical protein